LIIEFKEIFMKHALSITFATLISLFNAPAGADATLTYELTEADGSKTTKKFSTARLYVRIDDSADEKRYLLFEAAKFFPLYSVNQAESSYTQLTPKVIPYMGPETMAKKTADAHTPEIEAVEKAPPAVLKPSNKKRTIAGIRCRVINEMLDDKPVVEHCMVNSANLDVTTREVISMARTFSMARDRDFGWLAASTEDEEFISIQSRDLRTRRVFELTSVSNKPLAQGYLRIPREYKQVKAEKSAASTKDPAK
jgi:hypothetical protein